MTKLILEVKNGIGIGRADPVEQAQRGNVPVSTSPFRMEFGSSTCQSLPTNYIPVPNNTYETLIKSISQVR